MFRLLIAILTLATSFTTYAFDRENLLKAWSSSVVIRGYTEDGLAYGSGVVVAKDKVITNCHVLRKTKSPWVSFGETSFSVTGVQADRWHDLCLLSVFNLPVEPVPLGDSRNLKKGQEIVGIGHSGGAPVALTTGGNIIATYDFEGENIILSSAKFRMGASGSGLFDLKGNLIGINTFKTTGYGNYYSLPAAWIKALMNKEIETVFPINGKALWEEDEDKKPYFLKIAIPKTKKNWAELKLVTEKWVKDEPTNTEAWYELGYANEKLGKVADALVAYDKALEIDQNNSDALLREAVIYKNKGDANKVAQIQSTLDEVDPNKAWILKNNKY
ncbi:trypsin-like peptidase domain-containing protein [Methylophilaceae bacterium]|nr:trypsin-like peptidase domain-containing protein [Methylophilaceae bacterium]